MIGLYAQSRLKEIGKMASLPLDEAMWTKEQVEWFLAFMRENILNRPHKRIDDAVYAVGKFMLEKRFTSAPAPDRRKVFFSKVSDPMEWKGHTGFSLPNWRFIRWILKLFGFTVYGQNARNA